MGKFFEKLIGHYSSSAKVVDGNLILSLPDAVDPVVWRMELGEVRASALEVREDENGEYLLTLKTPKGDVNTIAPFSSRAKAIHALMAVSRAMENAHGHIRPQKQAGDTVKIAPIAAQTTHTEMPPGDKKEGLKWLAAIGGVTAVIALFLYLGSLTPRTSLSSGPANAAQSASPESPGETNGVPVSADDYLRGF